VITKIVIITLTILTLFLNEIGHFCTINKEQLLLQNHFSSLGNKEKWAGNDSLWSIKRLTDGSHSRHSLVAMKWICLVSLVCLASADPQPPFLRPDFGQDGPFGSGGLRDLVDGGLDQCK